MNADSPDGLLVDISGPIATVTLNRPEKLNALTGEMYTGLDRVMSELTEDDRVWVIVLTAMGRAFCAGVDLEGYIPSLVGGGGRPVEAPPSVRYFAQVDKPIIAAINGLCLAAGTEMVLGTDLRIAVREASFGLPEVAVGLVPSGGAHVRLPRQLPWAIAMELLLTGGRLSAERAHQVGLVNELVSSVDELVPRAMAVAERIAANGPAAVRLAKSIAVAALELDTPYRLETAMSRAVLATEDAAEGVAAFREGRRPVFRNR